MRNRLKIRVYGMVQGVGFRPGIAALAEELQISGKVKNAGGIVEIDAAGEEKAMGEFLRRLSSAPPEGAVVSGIKTEELPLDTEFEEGFRISESDEGEEPLRMLPPDLSTCCSCERELFDPANRRFRHPFISCQSCGPRYSILKQVPYDREHVTMSVYPMCDSCKEEYQRRGDRRRHAQTICCSSCGPELMGIAGAGGDMEERSGERLYGEAALLEAERILRQGGIVAVKDIGGFHFVLLPEDAPARRLRILKARERKPFAICFRDMASIREWCIVSEEEEALLTSPARPIVLLGKKKDFPEEVLQGSDRIGAMLPSNPLQMLLLSDLGQPLVMTSGNLGSEPISIHTKEMACLLSEGCPDLVLTHGREILSPLDDSIYQVTRLPNGDAVTQIIRRSRGIVPNPIILNQELKKEIFAAGGDLKASFAYGKGRAVYLSQYFGDLYEVSCERAREREMERMRLLFDFKPESSVGDLHPSYRSAKGADTRVQHHHAHVLSVMAEHGLQGRILGIAFDGTGYAADGTIWGSEFLICEGKKFWKKGSLSPVLLPGGDQGARNASLSLTGYLWAAGEMVAPESKAALSAEIGTIRSSSMGRLFDAAAALLQICSENTYEGQCAAELEIAAGKAAVPYPLSLPVRKEGERYFGDGPALIREMKVALDDGAEVSALALGFHAAVSRFTAELAERIAREEGLSQVALSGGSFVNRLLLKGIIPALRDAHLTVFWNEKVPCGDGGLALGQIYYDVL